MMKKKFIQWMCGGFLFGTIGITIGIYMEDRTVHYGHTGTFPVKRRYHERCQKLEIQTANPLNIHASGFINFNEFKSRISPQDYKKVYVINLLDDDIYYYKNRCLRWYGLGYKKEDLGEPLFHHKKLKYCYKSFLRFIYQAPPKEKISTDPSLVQTEREIVETLNISYAMPLKGRANWLEKQDYISDIIRFFESLPKEAILCVHCAHGKGRTTTFLALYDIFKYRDKLTLQQVADRHYCLNREDILDTTVWENGSWTQEALLARKELLTRFHLYMTSGEAGYPHLSWEEWSQAYSLKNEKEPLKVVSIHRL